MLTAAELYDAPAYPVLRQRLHCFQVALSTAAVENSGSAAAAHSHHSNLIPVPKWIRVPCLDAVAPGWKRAYSPATDRQWSRCQQETVPIYSLPQYVLAHQDYPFARSILQIGISIVLTCFLMNRSFEYHTAGHSTPPHLLPTTGALCSASGLFLEYPHQLLRQRNEI